MVQSAPKYAPTPILPLPGSLAPIAQEVVNALLDEASKDKITQDDLLSMLRSDPVSNVAIALKAMRVVTSLGQFSHQDKTLYPMPSGKVTITEWLRGNFESMRGSLVDSVRRMVSQCYALGFSIAQIVWTNNEQGFGREWRLQRINVLVPKNVDKFEVKNGDIVGIWYRLVDGKKIFIASQNLLHIYTDTLEGNNPRGDAHARRAHPFWKARTLLFQAWAIAGQKQATGTTVIQAPSNETVVETNELGEPRTNPDGSPKTISAIEAAKRAGQSLENNSILITDLANRVMNLPGNAGEGFFNTATIALKKEILLCYGVPSTIFDDTASGIGNAGINAGHRLILDVQTDSITLGMKEQLLEKVARPLLTWNYGVRNNFGDFITDKFLDPSLASARVSNLIAALSTGVIDATDIDAVNRLREDLGISAISKEEFDRLQVEKLMAQEQQAYSEDDNVT